MDKFVELINTDTSFQITWEIADICNFNCVYCNSHQERYSWPSLELCDKIITKIADFNGTRKVNFILLGGELVAWRDFPDFLNLIDKRVQNNIKTLITNGSAVKSYWTKRKINIDNVVFSFHSTQISVNKFIQNILDCPIQRKIVQVLINPMEWDESINHFNTIIQECKNEKNIEIRPKLLQKRSSDMDINMTVYTKEQLDFLKNHVPNNTKTFVKLRDKYDNIVDLPNPSDLIVQGLNNFYGWHCNIGVDKLSFKLDGSIAPASQDCFDPKMYNLGNWREGILNMHKMNPYVCTQTRCSCRPDMVMSKKKYV